MTTLYSCRHAGDQYRITKFDNDMNVEASYLCDAENCECPAGVRDTCRHRTMLHKFLARGAVNTNWFLDYDRSDWVQTDLGEALSGSVEDGEQQFIDAVLGGTITTEENGLLVTREVDLNTAGSATGRASGSTATFEDVAPAKPFRRGL